MPRATIDIYIVKHIINTIKLKLMKNTNNNYILTGATGILGSHIMYELMLAIHNNNYEGKLVLLLRSRKDATFIQRFHELFNADAIPDYLKSIDVDRICSNNVVLIDFDLKNFTSDITALLGDEKYALIHCAASVNL